MINTENSLTPSRGILTPSINRWLNKKIGRNLLLLVVSCCFLLWSSCNVINPKEELPTYIQIDSVQLKPTNTNKHGSTHQNITDVWVYYNREIIGPFELPARVPILAEGQGQIQVLAGIYENGLSATRVRYPFYTVNTFTFNASPTEIIKHVPQFNYRITDTPAVTYIIENFEQGNIFVKRFNNDTTLIRSNQVGKFEGDWSGLIHLEDTIAEAECITSTGYFIPPFKESFMELSFKSDIDIVVSTEIFYLSTTINQPIITLRASPTWKKVYLKLGGFADTYQGGKFKFALQAALTNNQTSANVWIDNFKIVYFN
jgi:hypothetical protein